MEAKDVYCEEVWERKLKPILDIADMLYILESSKERKIIFPQRKIDTLGSQIDTIDLIKYQRIKEKCYERLEGIQDTYLRLQERLEQNGGFN